MRSRQLGKLRQTKTVETISSILVTLICDEFCTLRRAKSKKKENKLQAEELTQDFLHTPEDFIISCLLYICNS